MAFPVRTIGGPTSYRLPRWCLALGAIACFLIFVLWQIRVLTPSAALFFGSCAAPFLGIHLLFRALEIVQFKRRGTNLAKQECRLGIPLVTMLACPLLFAACISPAANYCIAELHESERTVTSWLMIACIPIAMLWCELNYSLEQDGSLKPELRNFTIAMLLLVSAVYCENGEPAIKALAEFISWLSTVGTFCLALFELIRCYLPNKNCAMVSRSDSHQSKQAPSRAHKQNGLTHDRG